MTDPLVAGVSSRPATPLDHTHGRSKPAEKMSVSGYEWYGASMVQTLISIGPNPVDGVGQDQISRKRGIFIHGTQSLRTRGNGDQVQ